MSVVFHNAERLRVGDVWHLTSAELLSSDFVTIASNRDARVVAVRGLAGQDPAIASARLIAYEAEALLEETDPYKRAKTVLAGAETFMADLHGRDRTRSMASVHRTLANATALLAYLNTTPDE